MSNDRDRGTDVEPSVQSHYTVEDLGEAIVKALELEGKDPSQISGSDLAAVDEFHIRGRESTAQLAELAKLSANTKILDIGSGLGGTARYLATEHSCSVIGIDLTQSYCDVANDLSVRLNLAERTSFQCASALDLPFDDDKFDVVWTEHVQMNIEDKQRFYSEANRVLLPGGKLVFHDIFQGVDGELRFPVPWAQTSDISFLIPVRDVRAILDELGLAADHWIDSTEASRAWFEAALERTRASGPSPVGLHLLMGPTAKDKFTNTLQNLRERRIVTIQAVLAKSQ